MRTSRLTRASVPFFALLIGAAFAACGGGGGGTGPANPAGGGGESSASASAGASSASPEQWASMSKDDRANYMREQVVPRMGALLSTAFPDKFSKVTCRTCHGKNGSENGFKMPNPDLPALDPTDHFKAHEAKTPQLLHFMMEKVTPEMAALVGEKPYDPATKQGFGCFECHVRAH
jgi:hypothetical protein